MPFRTVIADDAPDMRLMVRLTLERSGEFEVVAEAGNGHEAIKLAEQHRPDLVLLDISMPVLDGLEALPQVLTACDGCKVVVFSGLEASRFASRALALGASAYVEKGLPPHELVDRLLGVLNGPARSPDPTAS